MPYDGVATGADGVAWLTPERTAERKNLQISNPMMIGMAGSSMHNSSAVVLVAVLEAVGANKVAIMDVKRILHA